MTHPSEQGRHLAEKMAAAGTITGQADTTDHITPVLVLVILIGAYYVIRALS